MSPQNIARWIGGALIIFAIIVMAAAGTYVVQPGFRGVEVTMGKVSSAFKPEGFGLKSPFVTTIYPISVRQQTKDAKAECFSSDLQQVQVDLRVLYRIPESSVVRLFQDYYGDPFDSLIEPRVQEALKEVTALQSAEQIVKNREQIKASALDIARKKVGTFLVVEDIVIQNIALTPQLESAIETKMVQEQNAQKAQYVQQRAQIDADTAVIQAKGEAESIRIRGEALKADPSFVDLKIVDKWDGATPLVIGASDKLVYQLQDLERLRQLTPNATSTKTSPGGNAGQ
ncbi:MAG TPA: prohibitin family protein [Verrucomicrobiae bacterium]|jgi:prohibitin 2|nr:prohibitin family protein [Verrucomicrobiae bacterium]